MSCMRGQETGLNAMERAILIAATVARACMTMLMPPTAKPYTSWITIASSTPCAASVSRLVQGPGLVKRTWPRVVVPDPRRKQLPRDGEDDRSDEETDDPMRQRTAD